MKLQSSLILLLTLLRLLLPRAGWGANPATSEAPAQPFHLTQTPETDWYGIAVGLANVREFDTCAESLPDRARVAAIGLNGFSFLRRFDG